MCKARLWGGWLLFGLIACPLWGVRDGYVLIGDGRLEQTIYVNGIRERVLREAVVEMESVLRAMVPDGLEGAEGSAAMVRIVIGRPPEGAGGIVVDPDAFPIVWASPAPDTVVWEAGSDRLVIAGRGGEGTALAIYRFLNREGGVRWYWPGDLGREVPVRRDWIVPVGRVVDQPAFESRTITGLVGEDARIWGFRNGLRSHYPGLHGLQRIFTEPVFRENPDWAAIPFDPSDPPGEGSRFWNQQPNLANPDVAAHVAAVARSRFAEDPGLRSFSIGVADNLRYGDRSEVNEIVEPRRWFRGQPVYTDLIFGFANQVAELVAPEFPDRSLVALAYQWGEAVPRIPLHPMVVPLLTADRAGGYAVDFTVEDQDLIRAWRAKGTRRMAIYEYWHGIPHLFPRQAMVLWAARLRDARESGVELFRGELNPLWGLDGAKPWVLVRLLWDPSMDVKVLEREFYGDFFGPAGPAVDAFFDEAEGVWMRQRGYPYWIRYYDDENGPLIFDDVVLDRMAIWLQRAREALKDSARPRYRERLAVIEVAFGLFRELHRLQRIRADLLRADDATGLGSLNDFADQWWRNFGEGDDWLMPTLRGRFRHLTVPTEHHLGLALAGDLEQRARLWQELRKSAVNADIIQLLDTAENDDWEILSGREAWLEGIGPEKRDGLDGDAFAMLDRWEAAVDPFEPFRASLDPEAGRVRMERALASGIRQRVPVEAGDWLWLSARIAARVSPGNRTSLFVRWFDGEGRNRIKSLPTTLPLGEFGVDEGGRDLHLVVKVPEGITDAEVYVSTVYQQPGDFLEITDATIRYRRVLPD